MFAMIFLSHSKETSLLNNRINAKLIFYLLLTSVTLTVVYRDLNYIDTTAYVRVFTDMRYVSLADSFNYFKGEKLFNSISWFVAQVTDNPRVYLFVLWSLFIIPFVGMLKQLFVPRHMAIVFFTYLNFIFFREYSTNVLRHGIAISFIMYALSLWVAGDKKKIKLYTSIILAALFHWSSIPFALILLMLTSRFKVKLKGLVLVWVTLATLFLTNINTQILRPIWRFVPNIDLYTQSSTVSAYAGRVNRIDFLAFSGAWVVIGLVLYLFIYREDNYLKILKVYILFNSVFLLLGFVAYSDRISIYSWFLIPLLIWYPIFNSKRYSATLSYLIILLFFVVGYVTGVLSFYNPFSIY